MVSAILRLFVCEESMNLTHEDALVNIERRQMHSSIASGLSEREMVYVTIRGILNVVLIGLSSFFDFGYFRIYEAFLHSYHESFFSDEDLTQIERIGKIRPDFWAHFMPGALYVIVSVLMMLIAIYY